METQSKTYLSQKEEGKREFMIPTPRNRRMIAIVPTAAESWFSVREETKRPMHIKVIPTRIRATKQPIISAVLTVAYL